MTGRSVTIFQVWSKTDPAESDRFFPTRALAMSYIRSKYGVFDMSAVPDKLRQWRGSPFSHLTVYMEEQAIELTREGICGALYSVPNR
jgi:hypothetical protein